jgi:hypothetical protein
VEQETVLVKHEREGVDQLIASVIDDSIAVDDHERTFSAIVDEMVDKAIGDLGEIRIRFGVVQANRQPDASALPPYGYDDD